jgi:hypothetical protein
MDTARIYSLKRNRFAANAIIGAPLTGPRPKLLDEVREAIRTRHYSPKTEESYVHWIKRFIFFHNKRHPGDRVTKKLRSFFQALPANCT